ncbi:hypothetical protein [Paraclostridium sp. AKS81]|uniref:hypothetical protein n=1 Tax=Paraclostridium sp. AKS81 TaxID=2876117 RepID=UPI0021E0CB99|nr:hypothetical protein [Paraclostridium sp. AKS81]MCU9811667.1 hypothetical protein [Paraclostridium sp. AKS81]
MNVTDLLNSALENFNKNMGITLENHNIDISALITKIDVIDNWSKIKSDLNCIKVLDEVKYDLITSIQFASMGIYRNAFISLRSALELGIGFISFVDNNYKYLLWIKNEDNITWASLKDKEKGVLSKKYITLFLDVNEDIVDTINIKADESYSICSEYVHGKYNFMQTLNCNKLIYDKEKFNLFLSTLNNIMEILNLLYSIRFKEDINLLGEENKLVLEELLGKFELREVALDGE